MKPGSLQKLECSFDVRKIGIHKSLPYRNKPFSPSSPRRHLADVDNFFVLCSPARSPKDVGFKCVFLELFFFLESFNMMPRSLSQVTDQKLPPKHTPQHHGQKPTWCFKVVCFFFARKEAMDDSATMLGYPRLKAEVCCLETNMGTPSQEDLGQLSSMDRWDRLFNWRVLLQSFTDTTLYYIHIICIHSHRSIFLHLVLWLFAFLHWCPRLSKVSFLFFFFDFSDFLALLHRFKDLSEGKNPCGYKVARSLGFVSKV